MLPPEAKKFNYSHDFQFDWKNAAREWTGGIENQTQIPTSGRTTTHATLLNKLPLCALKSALVSDGRPRPKTTKQIKTIRRLAPEQVKGIKP
jgi:hypothetical protein